MRFLRHLAAALLTVGVVVALGVAWEHSGAAGVIAGPDGGSPLAREIQLSRPGAVVIINGHPAKPAYQSQVRIEISGGAPPALASAPTLVRLAILEALIIAVAAVAERAWYRRRRARRLS